MPLCWLKCAVRYTVAVLSIAALPVVLWAQDGAQAPQPQPASSLPQAPGAATHREFQVTDYSKPKRHFPNPIAPYTPREVTPPDLTNSPKLSQLMRDGKIYLSMDDAVALALENNLDIAIQRYNLGIADTDVLRAKSGANQFLGVNSGVVQTTPGGGVGGL